MTSARRPARQGAPSPPAFQKGRRHGFQALPRSRLCFARGQPPGKTPAKAATLRGDVAMPAKAKAMMENGANAAALLAMIAATASTAPMATMGFFALAAE